MRIKQFTANYRHGCSGQLLIELFRKPVIAFDINPAGDKPRKWERLIIYSGILIIRLYSILPGDYRDVRPSPVPSYGVHEPVKRKLMRDITSLVLLFYVLFIFNSLIPVTLDVIAHTFWEKAHLANEHKLYGNNHLKAELENAAKQPCKEKTSSNNKTAYQEYLAVFDVTNSETVGFRYAKQSFPPHKYYLPVSHPHMDYRPPRT